MSTGYTHEAIEKKMGLRDFAMTCARAFGACVTLRDAPNGAPIPDEFKPSAYHIEKLGEARKELARLQAMKGAEKEAFANAAKASELKDLKDWLAKQEAENAYLAALEAQVREWKPPTPEHAELRDFMLQQIGVSKQDTGSLRKRIQNAKEKLWHEYWNAAIEQAMHDIGYHTKEDVEERERAAGRTKWIKDLRASLPR